LVLEELLEHQVEQMVVLVETQLLVLLLELVLAVLAEVLVLD
jgi:hypothetical protein